MIKIFDKGFDINKVLNREIQTYGEYESVVKEVIAQGPTFLRCLCCGTRWKSRSGRPPGSRERRKNCRPA